jgi:Fibronectin type III domain
MKLLKLIAIAIPVFFLGYFAVDKFVLSPHSPGSTTLAWSAPTENEDDDPLNDLAGYVIHCWGEAAQNENTYRIDDPATTSYEINNLSPGTYYCALTAVNADGGESVLSNRVAKNVR